MHSDLVSTFVLGLESGGEVENTRADNEEGGLEFDLV
jgi:hypothetical protein